MVMTPPLALVGLISGYMLVQQVKNNVRYKLSGCNVPKEPEWPIIGSTRAEEPHLTELRLFAKHRKICYSTLLMFPTITVFNPEMAHHILCKSVPPTPHPCPPSSEAHTIPALFDIESA